MAGDHAQIRSKYQSFGVTRRTARHGGANLREEFRLKRFKVAIVGAGYVCSHHLRALKTLNYVNVVAIVDVDQSRAQAVAGRFGIPRVLASVATLRPNEADVVHVLTPPDSHREVTLEALKAGCHVFVEKPMAEREQDCLVMMEAAARAGRVLSVNHSARMDPIVLHALEKVRGGLCGDVVGVDFFRSSDYPPYPGGPLPPAYRTGSYPFQDLGVHGISILETFLGAAQSADVKFWHRGSDFNLAFDEWRGTVECERGVGQIYLSWNSRPIRSEIFIHGTRASLHVDCFLQTCDAVKTLPGPKFLSNVIGGFRNSARSLWRIPFNAVGFAAGRVPGAPGIHNSIAYFYEALRDGRPAPIPPEEGRRIVAIMTPGARRADEANTLRREESLRPRPAASILVTGAAGFLGKHLTRELLNEGKRVRVLVHQSLPEWKGNPLVDVLLGDLGDPEVVNRAVEGIETVFHVGAAMRGGAADFERGTVWGTRNIVDGCVRHRIRKLVYVSSVSVLDHAGHDPSVPVSEASTLEPHPELRGYYTQAKFQAEQIVRSAVFDQSLCAVILRPGQIFGSGAEHVPPPGVIPFGKKWIVVGNGKRCLPLVHVEDVVHALLLAAQTKTPGLYNIVDTIDAVTQRMYFEAMSSWIGDAITIYYVPEWILLAAGWACGLLEHTTKRRMPLSTHRVRSIRPLHPFDTSAAHEVLGWTPAVGSKAALVAMAADREVPGARAWSQSVATAQYFHSDVNAHR